jgi:peptidoglycan/xylan/chitin deacetylase (PgdA/CDA1 family)
MRTKESTLPGLRSASDVLENWVQDFEYMKLSEQWGVLIYTFHPFVSGRGHRMLLLERLITSLLERGAVFMTVEEAALKFRDRGKRTD